MVWRYLVGLVGYFNKDCLFIKPTEAFKWAEDDCDVGLHKAVCEKGLCKCIKQFIIKFENL